MCGWIGRTLRGTLPAPPASNHGQSATLRQLIPVKELTILRPRSTWANVAVALLLAFVVYRLISIRYVPGPENGRLPAFAMQTLDGQRISPEDLRGKAVVLNFWATWCGPCRLEIPWLQRLATEHQKDGLIVIGVLQDDASDATVKTFMAEHHATYPVVRDHGEISLRMGGITGLPTTFYVGRDGKIVHAVGGLVPEALIRSYTKDILGPGQTDARE